MLLALHAAHVCHVGRPPLIERLIETRVSKEHPESRMYRRIHARNAIPAHIGDGDRVPRTDIFVEEAVRQEQLALRI